MSQTYKTNNKTKIAGLNKWKKHIIQKLRITKRNRISKTKVLKSNKELFFYI